MGEKTENGQSERIREYFKEREIDSVVFDLDGTLIDTEPYYRNRILLAGGRIANALGITEATGFAQELQYQTEKLYREHGQPILVNEFTLSAVERVVQARSLDAELEEKRNSVEILINNHFLNFYFKSPDLFPNTLRILHTLRTIEIPLYAYSHADLVWTSSKIARISNEYTNRYEDTIEIPFYSTEIVVPKDEVGWRFAQRYFCIDLTRSLVIGDSFTSDIQPSMNLGCRNHIWINNESSKVATEGLIKVPDIGNIFDHI